MQLEDMDTEERSLLVRWSVSWWRRLSLESELAEDKRLEILLEKTLAISASLRMPSTTGAWEGRWEHDLLTFFISFRKLRELELSKSLCHSPPPDMRLPAFESPNLIFIPTLWCQLQLMKHATWGRTGITPHFVPECCFVLEMSGSIIPTWNMWQVRIGCWKRLQSRLTNAIKETRAELIQVRKMLNTGWVSAVNKINRYWWKTIGYRSTKQCR